MSGRRIPIVPTLLVCVAIVVMIALGIWQLQRRGEKENMLALDAKGNLAGACTTSGMAWKLHGRVGDSPIIGAGLYVDNEVGAATASGVGEEMIRNAAAFLHGRVTVCARAPARTSSWTNSSCSLSSDFWPSSSTARSAWPTASSAPPC